LRAGKMSASDWRKMPSPARWSDGDGDEV
jgi:hypothetical protein